MHSAGIDSRAENAEQESQESGANQAESARHGLGSRAPLLQVRSAALAAGLLQQDIGVEAQRPAR